MSLLATDDKTDKAPSIQSVDMLARNLLRESRDELQRLAADDWPEISADPDRLIAFADLVAIREIRESGNCPDSYTGTTTCRRCGDVPIFPGVPDEVDACPWCINGLTAPPVPSPGADDGQ